MDSIYDPKLRTVDQPTDHKRGLVDPNPSLTDLAPITPNLKTETFKSFATFIINHN